MKDAFINRKYVIMALIVLASLVLIIRLFIIQVVKDSYRLSADNNVLEVCYTISCTRTDL